MGYHDGADGSSRWWEPKWKDRAFRQSNSIHCFRYTVVNAVRPSLHACSTLLVRHACPRIHHVTCVFFPTEWLSYNKKLVLDAPIARVLNRLENHRDRLREEMAKDPELGARVGGVEADNVEVVRMG